MFFQGRMIGTPERRRIAMAIDFILRLSTIALLFAAAPVSSFGNYFEANIEICGSEDELVLSDGGPMSSAVVTLEPGRENRCSLTVKAPSTHLIHVQFQEADLELHRSIINKPIHPPCSLDIFLPENWTVPVWAGDMCSFDHLPTVDLLNSDITLIWQSAMNPLFTKGRKIILTAIGQNEVCSRVDQHVCMRIGWVPRLCISKHLACNGHMNCPQGSTKSDEDENLCRTRMNFQELVDFFKTRINPNGSPKSEINITTEIKNIIIPNWKEIMKVETTTRPDDSNSTNDDDDSFLAFFTQNGIWGYMFAAGFLCVLSIIGCVIFVRKKNREADAMDDEERTATDPSEMGFPLRRNYLDPQPPSYDELDQPPSYNTLYPINKSSAVAALNPSRTIEAQQQEQEEIPMDSINDQREEPQQTP